MHPLIDVSTLSALLRSGAPVRLLDVRYRLDAPDGRPEYLAGHLPGAVYVPLEAELSRHGAPEDGRHPLPALPVLRDAVRRWGVNPGDTVVAYDAWDMLGAARLWWTLDRAGLAGVRVLDGGLEAWTRAGLPLEAGDVVPEPGTATVREIARGVASIDDAAAWPERGVLLDVRAPERYRGDLEPYDPVAGHIPGAVNLPSSRYVIDGRFAEAAAIRKAFAQAGVAPGTDVAAYCGSGITAAQAALAGAIAGIEVIVYPGSWSQWSNTPGRPVATGD